MEKLGELNLVFVFMVGTTAGRFSQVKISGLVRDSMKKQPVSIFEDENKKDGVLRITIGFETVGCLYL